MIHAHGGVRERKDKMTKKNYTKYSESSKDNNIEPTVEPTVEPEEIDEVEGVVLPNRLNVRKEASKDSDIVCIVTKDTSVVVILTESTEDFYKVHTLDTLDTEGYCMKEFIELR